MARYQTKSRVDEDGAVLVTYVTAVQITPDMPEASEGEYVGFWLTTDSNGNKGRVPDALFHEHFLPVVASKRTGDAVWTGN